MRTVLDNFLSQPGRFKYNRDQTRAFILRQAKSSDAQGGSTYTFEVYGLPDFDFFGQKEIPWLSANSSFIYLDVSDDEKFAIIGDDSSFVLCTLISLVPALNQSENKEAIQQT
jgi:hypothetical protein